MNYNIDSTIVPLHSLDTKLVIGNIIMLWNKDKQINLQLLVNRIEQDGIWALKVANDGIPIHKIKRSLFKIDNETLLNPFLISISGLSEKNFINVISLYIGMSTIGDVAAVNLIEIIKIKKGRSAEQSFIQWCDNKISELKPKSILKVN